MAQVRAAALTNYVAVARFVGLDPYKMLRRARISPAMLEDPDRRLPRVAVNALLTDSAREANCISFGLMMAESRELGNLGAITLLLRQQGTVRGVVEALARYRHLLGDTITIAIEDCTEGVAFRIDTVPGPGTIERQGVELAMGTFCRAIHTVSGERWRPDSVHFTHPAPGDPAVHSRVFGTKLVFGSSFNGFVSSAASLDARFSTVDAEMARLAENYLDLLAPAAPESMRTRVERSLELLLPLGRATLEQVGENLGLPPRTLQRLLDKEGQSFAAVLNAARRSAAIEHLSHSNRSLAEIAQIIGYSNPSSFSRWFYAEFGVTPNSWRAGDRPAGSDAPLPRALPPRASAPRAR